MLPSSQYNALFGARTNTLRYKGILCSTKLSVAVHRGTSSHGMICCIVHGKNVVLSTIAFHLLVRKNVLKQVVARPVRRNISIFSNCVPFVAGKISEPATVSVPISGSKRRN